VASAKEMLHKPEEMAILSAGLTMSGVVKKAVKDALRPALQAFKRARATVLG
jgi:hypothetical protein